MATLLLVLALGGCDKKQDDGSKLLVRGLRTYKVSANAESRTRQFPTILQPAVISQLSFEIAGQLKEVDLKVGQRVKLGDVLMEIDPRSLQTQVEQARAALKQAQATLINADADFGRKAELLKTGFATRAAFDQSQAAALSARAQVDQAQQQLDLSIQNLNRSQLRAPFDGIIAGVDTKSFAQVATGQSVLMIYTDDDFEMSFQAPATVVGNLKTGQSVQVKIADRPDLALTGTIVELGSLAEHVSAFPVVVRLKNEDPRLRAGMSAEISLELPLTSGTLGYLVPLSVLALDGPEKLEGLATVFVFDPATSTVVKRKVQIGGVRDNRLVVTDGLLVGDLIASAGVSYLTDGEKVRLLPAQE